MSDMVDFQWRMSGNLKRSALGALAKLAGMSRSKRRWLAVVIDACLCVLATWIAMSLRLGEWDLVNERVLTVAGVALLLWFPIAWRLGIYLSLIRFAGGRTMAGLGVAIAVFTIPMAAVFLVYSVPPVPRTMALIQPIIFLGLLCVSRLAIRFALIDVLHVAEPLQIRKRVAIYGAGRAGQQLALALRHERQMKLVCFLDDDRRLNGQRLDGIPIHPPAWLEDDAGRTGVDEVLIALPTINRGRRREIIERLQALSIAVRALPSVGRIIDGDISISDLREIEIEDLLGRDPVRPNVALMSSTIAGKTVLVSGAGGSIGSELCRQIILYKPKRLVLVEQSEFALYAIESELSAVLQASNTNHVELCPELANISDRRSAYQVFQNWRADTVFHAAAYKHVPLIEANPLAGIRNNIFGTFYSCLAAQECGVSKFILISTDKAVRPTNIMGASKRICELILQARAQLQPATIFTMVRFGNVLGSSGSVVPKFRAQILKGGPITLTHRDIIRYFMTIPEAAQLVIQAGAMAKGGEVFVLDMGDPVRIDDLARTMIRLSGLTIRDESNPDGDIEIVETGLRPGEKLYEELLIGDNPRNTHHPRIMQAHETMLAWTQLEAHLKAISEALDVGDKGTALDILRQLVPEYAPPVSAGEDHGK
jgi:FlaA1/EpsC-like NDP-sugar epimerase